MTAPLADRLRPTTLDQIVGHERWLGPDGALRRGLDEGTLRSLILWGPPGCGKTTLARILAADSGADFVQLSAVLDGVKALRQVIDRATGRVDGRRTLLFVDEIHRWNKAQQDALLPHVESGLLVLIGATTENPSFEITAALRSRVQLIRLEPVPTEDVVGVLVDALARADGLAERQLTVEEDALSAVATAAAGDVRQALSDLERIALAVPVGATVTLDALPELLRDRTIRHDKGGEDHYNVLSALIKSMRGSDPDAAIYWLARLIRGGESPTTIARRLIIFASEDVGNADPRALDVAVNAALGAERVGWPEARIILAQAVTWLATSPKSNAAYNAINAALADVDRHGALPVPLPLRNAQTREMKAEGYGRGYRYPHDFPDHIVAQDYLPEALRHVRYYQPANHAEERRIAERLDWWQRRLAQRGDD